MYETTNIIYERRRYNISERKRIIYEKIRV